MGIFKVLNGKLFSNSKVIATNWVIVFIFPSGLAAIVTPSAAARTLKPVIVNSLAIIITTTHAGTLPNPTREISAADTRILSARGSTNFPSL